MFIHFNNDGDRGVNLLVDPGDGGDAGGAAVYGDRGVNLLLDPGDGGDARGADEIPGALPWTNHDLS